MACVLHPTAVMRLLLLGLSLLVSCGDDGGNDLVDALPIPPDGDPVIDAGIVPDASATAPLTSLSDEFSGAGVGSSWLLYRGERLSLGIVSGELNVVLDRGHNGANDSSLWFNDNEGSAVYKRIAGDFIATAAIRVRRADPNSDQAPLPSVRLGGIIARDETSAAQNYLFVVSGYDVDDLSVETKDTRNSQSQFVGPTTGNSDAELRLCRVGTSFRLYHRPIGDTTWQLAAVPPAPGSPAAIDRPDLPQTLQVGLILYTNQSTPDVQMFVDYVRFRRPASAADCTVD